MPLFIQRVQTHVDILNTLAKAQALGKEVVVNSGGRVAIESRWGRFTRLRQERANGADWTANQNQLRNTAVATSLKAAIARQGVDIDALPQAHHLRSLLNAIPAKSTLPGVKLFSEGVKQIFPGFNLKDPSLDRFRPSDVDWAPGSVPAPAAAPPLPTRRGPDLPVPRISPEALRNPNDPNAPLPENLKKVHANLPRLMHPPRMGVYRDELGQVNRFQFEAIDPQIGKELPKTLDRSKIYLYVLAQDTRGNLHLRLGFEHALRSDPTTRLGHPTLTQDLNPDAKALIGGELRYNPEVNGWEIDENSGRYGLFPEHLLPTVGVTIGDVLQYAAFRFEAVGFRVANINSILTRQTIV